MTLSRSVFSGTTNRHFGSFQGSFLTMEQSSPSLINCINLALPWHCLLIYLPSQPPQMQFNDTYVPDKAPIEGNKPMKEIYYNQELLQICSPILDSPVAWETLLQRESAGQFQKETEQTMNNLHSEGDRSTRMLLNNRREKNRERERKRQMRLKGAFNVLRSVIPDYISKREPGDRLSRIQTLRLAKKYITTLHELLETC